MKKISMFLILIIIMPLLLSCTDTEPEIEPFTFELIGESTVYVEEGLPYIDQGVLIDGEPTTDISYMTNVDTKIIGTYYVEFMHYDQTLLRTVIVTEGAKTIYTRMIEELKTAESFTYSLDLEISYKLSGIDKNYYRRQTYDVYGNYTFGHTESSSLNGTYEIDEYTYRDPITNIIERYSFDDYGFGYFENQYFGLANIAKTDFVLDYFSFASRELIDDEYVYTVYIKPGGYDTGLLEYINYIEHIGIQHRNFEPLKIVVYTEDEHITKIIIDISQALEAQLDEPHTITDLSYIFVYEYSNINQLEPIVIPEEALAMKN